MKQYLTLKNLLIVAILLGIISFIIYLFSLLSPKLPIIIKSLPKHNSLQNSVTNPLIIQFDAPVIFSDFTIISTPKEDWTISQVDNQTISINHQKYLFSNTKYMITLSYKGRPLPDYVFTTAAGQSDPRFLQDIKLKMDMQFPLMAITPYNTSQYRVVYSAPLTLEITIKNRNLTTVEAIDQVKSWVTKNGGDADSHKYVIAATSN
jgi:hypothetical protein